MLNIPFDTDHQQQATLVGRVVWTRLAIAVSKREQFSSLLLKKTKLNRIILRYIFPSSTTKPALHFKY